MMMTIQLIVMDVVLQVLLSSIGSVMVLNQLCAIQYAKIQSLLLVKKRVMMETTLMVMGAQ